MDELYYQTAIIIVIFLILIVSLLWVGRRRAEQERARIVPWYEPPDNLSPPILTRMLYTTIEGRELLAEVLFLVQKGSIELRHEEEGRLYMYKTAGSHSLSPFEQGFMDALFEYRERVPAGDVLAQGTVRQRITSYFTDYLQKEINPQYYTQLSIRLTNIFLVLGILLLLLSVGAFFYMPLLYCLFFGVVFLCLANAVLAKNAAGKELYRKTLGFRHYLEIAEQDRIQFHSGPHNISGKWEKYLPYAVAFGLERKWAWEFSTINPELYKLYAEKRKEK